MTTQDIDLGVVARGPQGPKGEQGNAGPAPTLKIGTVTKLGPNQTPTANLSGGNGSYTLNMGIPQGVQGETDATATNALNKVTAIQTNGGGRNLLVGTGTASGDVASGDGSVIKGAFNGYDAVKTNGAWQERFTNLKSALGRTNAKAGDWYTISVYVKADKQIDTGSLDVYRALGNVDANANDGYLDGIQMQDKPITTQWQQYSWSFQINDISLQRQNTRVEYNCDTSDNWMYWAGWMLEKGTVAHDWQPAPEDIQSEIDASKTATTNAQNTANKALSKANSNAAVLNNKANKSDLTWANISGKPSIPNADDTTTVSSGDLNNYTTTGKYYMPNSLVNYTNHPTTDTDIGDWFIMKVDAYHGGDMIVQTIYQINSGDVWVRQRWSNSWKSWRQINFWS